MMGSDNQGYEDARLYTTKDRISATLLHHEPSPSNGSNSFHDPLSSSSHFVDIPTSDHTDHPHSIETPNPTHSSINSILEPPSYAEAVFQSFDLHSVDSPDTTALDHSASASPKSFSTVLKISVSDPNKEPGATSYFSYLITTFTNMPEFSGTEFNVRRRFRDVVALSDRLGESYRGFFIPLRPDKSVVESQVMQKNEFLEQRRAALEKYLRRLAAHPVLRNSEELRAFLEPSDGLQLSRISDSASRMLEGADSTEVAQPAKGGRDFLRMFKELKQSVANDWSGAKPPLVEDDKEFLDKKEKMQDFEQQLINVSQQAESLVKAQQDIGETMGQLGLAFVKLTKFETEEVAQDSQRAHAADMKNVATAAVKASRLYRELNAKTVKHLDKLHEYLGVMLAVNIAFSDRASAFLTVQTLLSELSSLHSRIEKLEAASSKIFGGDRSRIRKIEELRENIRITENAKSSAAREYKRIKENNKTELERLEKEKHDDFVNMLKGLIVNQAGYAEKMANVWETVAEETSAYIRKS
ncbi:sorting nexin 2B-like [Salvia splendens]|uniref:sorting nexin 2B-like n=1 Tax=Salvia splendens TaxID=180675 RepID=UPI001103A471|nr:sorting nexin 2B-like [Salvia splendens]